MMSSHAAANSTPFSCAFRPMAEHEGDRGLSLACCRRIDGFVAHIALVRIDLQKRNAAAKIRSNSEDSKRHRKFGAGPCRPGNGDRLRRPPRWFQAKRFQRRCLSPFPGGGARAGRILAAPLTPALSQRERG